MHDYLVREGIHSEQISVVDLRERTPTILSERQIDSDSQLYKLLYVGRLTYDKGVQYLLRALKELDCSFELEIAGDGWFLSRAKALAMELGIADRTRFLGNIMSVELSQAYQGANLVIVPTILPEPVGLVVGEARLHGVPVVVSEAGGLPEWADGDSGVIVAPRCDAKGLAGIIRDVRDHPPISSCSPRPIRWSLADEIERAVQVARGSRGSR
jgi:glycosyltransferase involved in cell wall biosynthesis